MKQGTQTRTFRYDSLGRLTSVSNPENGVTTYAYDYNGNVISKTDALGVITCFGPAVPRVLESPPQCNATATYGTSNGYDGLNRPTVKQYTDGTTPSVTYNYCLVQSCAIPNIGRLQTVSNGTTVQYTKFDANGRVLQHSQSDPLMNGGVPAQFSYVYNLAGSLTNVTYPYGHAITTGYDPAGRPAALSGTVAGTTKNYVDAPNAANGLDRTTCSPCIQYSPHGGILQTDLSQVSGNSTFNEKRTYNARLQPTSIATTLSSGAAIRGLTFGYAAGSQADGLDNNGNLLTQTISGVGIGSTALTQTYSYDGANRIASASEGLCAPIAGFRYDTWGNGWVWSWSGACYNPQPNTPVANVYNSTTNRSTVNNAGWDNAGRQTSIGGVGGASFTYDAENRMTSATLNATTTMYQYDGDGRRVAKITCPAGTTMCTAATAGANTVWYVYNAAGDLAAEYGQSNAATVPPCATCYVMADHLGSTRVVMDQNGNPIAGGCHDYLPFGEEIYAGVDGRSSSCYPAAPGSGLLFTGKERDAVPNSVFG